MEVSKELLQCLNKHLTIDKVISNTKNRIDNNIYWSIKELDILQSKNVYELVHLKLKEWTKLKNFFDKIDWSEEPEEILKKAEELRNQINEKQLQH